MEDWEIHWKDYYKILQVDPVAEQEVIKGAYDRLAKKYHPDASKDPRANERMREINGAYEVLGNPEKRGRYDAAWRQRQREGTYKAEASESPRPTAAGAAKPTQYNSRFSTSQSKRRLWGFSILGIFIISVIVAVVSTVNEPAPQLSVPSSPPATESIPSPKPQTPSSSLLYSLSTTIIPLDSGSVSPNSGIYDSDTLVTLTANPLPGYQFDYWSGDASGTAPSSKLIMDSNKSVVANFARIQVLAESHHPYANNYDYTWTISEPGAAQIRLHFTKLDINDDYLYLLDKDDQELASYYRDYYENHWTDWFTGDTLKLRLETNGSDTAYGFVVDRKETK